MVGTSSTFKPVPAPGSWIGWCSWDNDTKGALNAMNLLQEYVFCCSPLPRASFGRLVDASFCFARQVETWGLDLFHGTMSDKGQEKKPFKSTTIRIGLPVEDECWVSIRESLGGMFWETKPHPAHKQHAVWWQHRQCEPLPLVWLSLYLSPWKNACSSDGRSFSCFPHHHTLQSIPTGQQPRQGTRNSWTLDKDKRKKNDGSPYLLAWRVDAFGRARPCCTLYLYRTTRSHQEIPLDLRRCCCHSGGSGHFYKHTLCLEYYPPDLFSLLKQNDKGNKSLFLTRSVAGTIGVPRLYFNWGVCVLYVQFCFISVQVPGQEISWGNRVESTLAKRQNKEKHELTLLFSSFEYSERRITRRAVEEQPFKSFQMVRPVPPWPWVSSTCFGIKNLGLRPCSWTIGGRAQSCLRTLDTMPAATAIPYVVVVLSFRTPFLFVCLSTNGQYLIHHNIW